MHDEAKQRKVSREKEKVKECIKIFFVFFYTRHENLKEKLDVCR